MLKRNLADVCLWRGLWILWVSKVKYAIATVAVRSKRRVFGSWSKNFALLEISTKTFNIRVPTWSVVFSHY